MRFLFATTFLPEPPLFGGTQRSHLLHRALAEIGDVDLLVVKRHPQLSDAEEEMLPRLPRVVGVFDPPPIRAPLALRALQRVHRATGDRLFAEYGALHEYRPDPRVVAWRREHADAANGRYDLVFARHLITACRLGAGRRGASTPVITDFDDANHLYLRSIAEQTYGRDRPFPWETRLKLRVHTRLVLARLRRTAHVFFTSANDRADCPGVRGSVLPNIPLHLPPAPLPPPAEKDAPPLALFVGVLTWPPNREGVRQFLERAWPRVRERAPAARLRLVGKIDPADQRAWSALPAVEALGRVPEIESHYAAARVCLAPMQFGAGTNIKVLEAAAHARPSVVSPFAHYGFEAHLRDGECVLRAETDAAFAERVIELLTDHTRAAVLGATGRRVIEEQYSFPAFAATVRAGVEAALGVR